MYQYKSTKYKIRYGQLLANHLAGASSKSFDKIENDLIMTYLTDLYTSAELKIQLSYKPNVSITTNSDTNSGSDTEEECCQICSDDKYCSSCIYTSTCGCRMTALFFYLGYHYITSNLTKPITVDNLDRLKLPIIRHIINNKNSYYSNTIIEGTFTRKQQANYDNYLKEAPNIVGIFQKFIGNDPNAHAFHYLFVLKTGDDISIRQSWYDGGSSMIKLDFIQLKQATNLDTCVEIVKQTEVTKDDILAVYGSFLTSANLEYNTNIFPIYVLN